MTNPVRKVFDFKGAELRVALLLFSFFFLAIAVFQMLKPVKNGLFIEYYKERGADMELYAKLGNIAAAALGMAAFTYLYNRVARQRLLSAVALFFVAAFSIISLQMRNPGTVSVWTFYLLGDLVSTMLVAAFWAYLTDISDSNQAKRLFGPIGAGGVIGGWAGATSARLLLHPIGDVGVVVLAIVLMVLLVPIILITESQVRASAEFRKQSSAAERQAQSQTGSKSAEALEGAKLVFRSSYLAAIVGIMAFYEIASQLMDYQFKRASQSFGSKEATQAFMAGVYSWATLLSVVVQLFLVSFIMRRFGLVTALMILPVSLIASSLGFFLAPTLVMVSLLVVFDNGLNYSLQQTARESLYTPTTPDEKYKARAFTNMFMQRFAKGLSIFAVMALGALGVGARYLSLFTIAVLVLMALCGIYAGRRFAELSRVEGERRVA
jgi:AAA family ATP:ADP antiporter